MKRTHFETFMDAAGEGRFRLVAANGEVVLLGEGYKDLRNVHKAIRIIMRTTTKTPVVPVHPPGWTGKDRFGNDALEPPKP